jgi:plastocyanin
VTKGDVVERKARRLIASTAVLGMVVLGAACSSDDGDETSTAASEASSTTAAEESTTSTTSATVNTGTEVSVSEFAFEPQTPTIAVGESVTWVNHGSSRHTVTAKPDAAGTSLFKSEPILPEQSFVQTFNTAGTYDYICSIHPEKMSGQIVVQ